MREYLNIALRPNVCLTALRVSLVVGTILALINHGSAIIGFSLSIGNVLQIFLTYLVPYAVSTYSAVKAIQSAK